jgi:AcrR family transcriptional regulator
MNDISPDATLDPRVRRSRQWLQDALSQLLLEKPYSAISVTDITKRADLARVTFYQHFDSKDDLLLSLVTDFFAQIYEKLDVAMFDAFVERGDLALAQQMARQWNLDPTRLHLVQVALEEVGPAVRELAITSFLRAQSKHGVQDEQFRQVIATYHVAGRMALLEQCLRGDLDISYEATKVIAWIFLRALIVDVRDHDWLRTILQKD